MNLNGIELVVFDMAGTTIEEGKTVYKCVQKVLKELDIDLELDVVFRAIGGMNKAEGIEQLIDQHAPDTSIERRSFIKEKFYRTLIEEYKVTDEITAFPGAVELFRELHSAGIKVALDTGYSREIVNLLLKRLDWEGSDLIDFTVTSDEVASGRPAADMIHKIMDHLGVTDSQKVVKVGDTRSDMEEGINANCKYIVGVESNMYKKSELMELGATHVVTHLMEIMDLAKV